MLQTVIALLVLACLAQGQSNPEFATENSTLFIDIDEGQDVMIEVRGSTMPAFSLLQLYDDVEKLKADSCGKPPTLMPTSAPTTTGAPTTPAPTLDTGTVLQPGDVAVVAAFASSPTFFQIVLLVDVEPATTILITDHGVKSDGTFRDAEDVVVWKASGLTRAFTVLSSDDFVGSLVLDTTGDQLHVFQGSVATPTHIFAFSTVPFAADAVNTNTGALPPTLALGVNAIEFNPTVTNTVYTGARFAGTQALLLQSICNAANWFRGTDRAAATSQLTSDPFSYPKSILVPQDAAIFGVQASNPDDWQIVLTVDVAAGTMLSVTDNGARSDGTFFSTGEGVSTWTASTMMVAGSVLTAANFGSSSLALSTGGDHLYLFQGTLQDPRFLYAFGLSPFSTATNSNNGNVPDVLSVGTTAVAMRIIGVDDAAYTGLRRGEWSALLSAIGDVSNYDTSSSARNSVSLQMFNEPTAAPTKAPTGAPTASPTIGGTLLGPGDAIITNVRQDNDDEFRVVLLVDVIAETVITITDDSWLSTGAFAGGEDYASWTAATTTPAGTVLNQTQFVGNTLGLTNQGEVIYLFQGAAASPVFIYCAAMTRLGDSSGDRQGTLPSSLVLGISAIEFNPHVDNVQYLGSLSGTKLDLQTRLSAPRNYNQSDDPFTSGQDLSAVTILADTYTGSNLVPGDAAVFGLQTDTPDNLQVVLLTDVLAGTVLQITDRGANADGSFHTVSEPIVTWTATAVTAAGTVLALADFVGGALNLNSNGDQVYLFQGPADNPRHLFSMSVVPYASSVATGSQDGALPYPLIEGVTGVDVSTHIDNMIYDGTRVGTKSDLFALLGNISNYRLSDNTFTPNLTAFTVVSP